MNASTEFLLDAALRGAGVLALALMLGVLLSRVAAARRYALWTAAMVLLAVLPIAMQMLPGWHVLPQEHEKPLWELPQTEMPLEATAQPVEVEMVALPETEPAADLKPVSSPEPVLAAKPAFSWKPRWEHLPLFWLVVAAGMVLRLFISAWRLRRLEKTLPEGACTELDRIARQLGLSRAPKLLIGAADAVPMVWGVWHARLLLPRGFESWSTEKLRGVLHHELAHLRRRDPLMLWLAQAVKALHWFNPLARLTLRALRADQERACDDSVLRAGVRPSDYAQHLLDLSRHSRAAPGLALCALTMTRCAPVESRVRDILDPKRPREPLTTRWLLALLFFAALGLIPAAMLRAIEAPKLRGRILDRHGRVLAQTTKYKMREYPLGALVSHVTGYVGLTKFDDPTPKGRAGLEKRQEETLRAGKDVTLTLDARLQSLTERAMREGGITRGAAVVLDTNTGEILAMVSLPTYDANVFVPRISIREWEDLSKNLDHPLLNRSVAEFTPGSAYKPFTALAGIAAGAGERRITCDGSVTYGNKVMQCWIQRQNGGKHGELDLAGALTASCSCYFYQFGNAAGHEAFEKVGSKLGLGARYGVTDDERDGVLPLPSSMQEHEPNTRWSAGYLANLSIGQGQVLVTPLQMAVLAATVANAGKVPEPVLQPKMGAVAWRADLVAEGLPAAQIEQIREGMRRVVHATQGTGQAARIEKVIISGKTGTAQSWRRNAEGIAEKENHAWFIGFAPYDSPKLAFAILKNGGNSGGGDCAPVAKRIVEEALAVPADGSGEVKPAGVNGQTTSVLNTLLLSSPQKEPYLVESQAFDWHRDSFGWPFFKLVGRFAELPDGAETQADLMGLTLSTDTLGFIFTTPSEEVLKWLEDSLGTRARELPGWPKQTGPFTVRTERYGCLINCVCQDGQKATVWLALKRSLPLREMPRLNMPPEGPTIPKNLPEVKKPRFDRMATILRNAPQTLELSIRSKAVRMATEPYEDEDDPRTLENRIRRMDRTLVP